MTLKKVAKLLSGFHLNALRNPEIDEFGEPERFKVNTDENFEQIEQYIGLTVNKNIFSSLKRWTEAFYEENRFLFYERIRQGRVRGLSRRSSYGTHLPYGSYFNYRLH